MDIFSSILSNITIPKFVKVHQEIHQDSISDVYQETLDRIKEKDAFSGIHPGDSVCIACGSRDINKVYDIVRAVVESVREKGGNPFISPAMGSHGGATAEGQKVMLETYGLTPEKVGAEIHSSMDTVKVGVTPSGLDVRIDKNAAEADVIILVARVKPHTDFRGPVESGMQKMISIGMGKQYGASICHSMGFPRMSQNVHEIAEVVIHTKKVIGIGVIENAFHKTYQIRPCIGDEILSQEPEMLLTAKSLMPKFPFPKCDVLFVDEIGKNISGPGMDSNVTGRSGFMGTWEPYFDGIAVFDLTPESHHNGNGIGNADVTTQRFFNKFSRDATYVNAITCMDPGGVKMPAVMPTDLLAMKFALNLAYQQDPKLGPKVIWIHNTLCMENYYISEGLIPEAKTVPGMSIESEPMEVRFNEDGSVVQFEYH